MRLCLLSIVRKASIQRSKQHALTSCSFLQDDLNLHSSAVVVVASSYGCFQHLWVLLAVPATVTASVYCRLSFLLIAMLDVVALISSTILYYRTRHIYKVEYQELHQHDEDMQQPHSTPNFPTGGANMGHIASVSDSETMSS